MPAPRWLARFNLHVTNRLLSPLANHLQGMGVIVHIGRRTHRRYRTPVLIFRCGNHLIIALTYGRESQWVQNVLATDGCELENRGRLVRLVHPRVFHDPQRRTMPAFVRVMLRLLDVSDFLEVSAAEEPSLSS
jgi:deazaflavin-dependent oxidoreductase (nitroreductase family)